MTIPQLVTALANLDSDQLDQLAEIMKRDHRAQLLKLHHVIAGAKVDLNRGNRSEAETR